MTPVVALVGFGRWAPNILRDLRELGCTVPVVARSDATARRAAEAGAPVARSIAALPQVDGVVVATSMHAHAEVAEEALGLGVPVYVEKPLTPSVAEAERLLALAPDRLFVMEKWRYHPGIEALRDLVRTEELGPVAGLDLVRDSHGDFTFDVDSVWRHLPHDLSLAHEILGFLPEPAWAVGEVVDEAAVGLQGVLRDPGPGPWVHVRHTSTHPERRREVRVCCAGGTAWLADAYDEHVLVARGMPGRAEPERRETPGEWPLLRQLRAFVEHLAGGPPPKSSAADGVLNVRRLAGLRALAGLD
ncbi:MAG TPA: Gfo/Idh/MocA family oxidoreductase [Solirubrobacteraceae bacterium]|nr:Gfo/Idh/MocA family oxidoreductase [Solirubrobacteraceae bacterium]